MKIGIDISQIVYEGTGVSRFTHGLVSAILNYDKENEWVFFFSSLRRILDLNLEKKIIEKGHKLVKWKLPPTALAFLFNDLHKFSKYLISSFYLLTSLDWFITSDWTEPPLPVKKATIVHDLVYLRYPETVDNKIVSTQKKRLSWVKKESEIVFADSYTTKKDLMDLLKVDSRKIIVNYPGIDVKKPTLEQINITLKKYNLKKPFILAVGKSEPRKNFRRLIEAFSKRNDHNLELVIVGPMGWDEKNIKYQSASWRTNIKYLGLVSDTELFSLYSSCLFFVCPSIWEGFGYPVVEAMRLGVPLATSNTSSLSEITKDAAILFNPFNVNDIYKSMVALINDKNLRINLAKKGLEKSRIFTWKKYYNNMIAQLASN
ncbi:hypothetical protein A2859_00260 [Candidatus Roizmanbacteria bacterium RIFCSPHIGHO2_01_FULL_37_16b]|nr:MAG: hypothetical protein A2859_00260 [Candidatus Roizmanbacteria bacterium RIFCSPHIGHO2_01_FULL_37_16b]OGK31829.1 MAG: hypothetical protein A3F57_02200 [Candidatus Roizmanbacteria bacterium RIFCSPHIGHO2_12_FULL_36_11]